MIPLHVTAGLLALGAGAVALVAAKGGALHRKSGLIFVWAMLLLTGSGIAIAAMRSQRFNVVAGTLTLYLVATALLTVKRPPPAWRWIDRAVMWAAFALAITSLTFGFDALARGKGPTAAFYFVFGSVALLGAIGDMRVLAHGIAGAPRIARHLWRMGLSLWIATASLFLGQAKVFPEPLRKPALLAIPVLLVLLAMLYWLARVLITHKHSRA
jgi:hypothetical protein